MRYRISALFFFILLIAGCKQEIKQKNTISIISYNLQNFFDGEDNGREYDEYLIGNGIWNSYKYGNRLKCLVDILKKAEFSDSDIIFFQEVENSNILKALLESGLSRRGFKYYGSVNNDTPLSIGFISKIKPVQVNLHSVVNERAVLAFECFINGEQTFIYALHLKSKLGDEADNSRRQKQMAILMRLLSCESMNSNVIFIGDFNVDFMQSYTENSAFIPLGFYTAKEILDISAFPITGDRRLVCDDVFYSPYLDISLPLKEKGTYYYKGEWSYLDNVLINRKLVDNYGLEFRSFGVLALPEMLKDGRINSYDLEKGVGLSDHLAIKIELEGVF